MHIFREDASSIDQLSEKQKDNRSRFITFCQENGFVICNTWYQKSLSKLVTYRNVAAPNFQGPYTTDRYSQLDYVLINQRWKNCIQNVETNDQHAVSTDHKLLVAEARVKLAKRKKAHVCSHPKFRNRQNYKFKSCLINWLQKRCIRKTFHFPRTLSPSGLIYS